MAVNNEINIQLKAQDKASGVFKGLEGNTKTLDSKFSKLSGVMATVGKGLGVVGVATGVAGVKMFNLADDIETTLGKAEIVFGEYFNDMDKFAFETGKAMGLSRSEFLKTAAGIQDLLIPMGFTREEATGMTQDMISLSGALSEWSAGQYDAAQVGDILAKAMLGEREQLKSLGISITEADVQQRLLINGTNELTGAALQQAKALATQELIMEKSTDAQKAFEDGTDSLTRKKAELTATLKNAQETIAMSLLPAFHEIANAMIPIIEDGAEMIEIWAGNEENIENLTSSLKSAITVFSFFGKVVNTVIGILYSAGEALGYILSDIIIKISSLYKSVKNTFGPLIETAKEWGSNLVKMFVEGLKSALPSVSKAVRDIATTISDFLAFHSPTKEGPASDSDKWMPNLIGMLVGGLEDGESDIQKAAERIASSLAEGINSEGLTEALEDIQISAISAFDSISTQISGQKSNVSDLINEYKGLKAQIGDINTSISGIKSEGSNDIAERALELEDELKNIQNDIRAQTEETTEVEKQKTFEKLRQVEAELLLAQANTTQAEIEAARIENAKTETQLIIDKMNAKILEAEEEKIRIKDLMDYKKEEILSEASVYEELIEQKKELDKNYFQIFSNHLKTQQSEIETTITKMKQLLSMSSSISNDSSSGTNTSGTKANGGSVDGGSAYLVGERGPEMFVPSGNGNIVSNSDLNGGLGGININMGGVTVNNSADEDRLIEKMKRELSNMARLNNIGVAS